MKQPVIIDPRSHDAVLFDLDGVVTDTTSIHAKAWATMFDDFLTGRGPHEGENHSRFTSDDYRHFVDGKPRDAGVTDFLASRGISVDRGSPAARKRRSHVPSLERQLFRGSRRRQKSAKTANDRRS